MAISLIVMIQAAITIASKISILRQVILHIPTQNIAMMIHTTHMITDLAHRPAPLAMEAGLVTSVTGPDSPACTETIYPNVLPAVEQETVLSVAAMVFINFYAVLLPTNSQHATNIYQNYPAHHSNSCKGEII